MGKKLGIVSLIFGIIGAINIILIGFVFPLHLFVELIRIINSIILLIIISVAIVCGGIGIKKDDSPGLAIAGLVLGSIGVIIWLFRFFF